MIPRHLKECKFFIDDESYGISRVEIYETHTIYHCTIHGRSKGKKGAIIRIMGPDKQVYSKSEPVDIPECYSNDTLMIHLRRDRS